MKSVWICLCGLLALVCAAQATYTSYPSLRCDCNGRARYCLRDVWGLRCLSCQGNTEGRHCERCKPGFYLQEAGQSCTPCHCNSTGSVGPGCDSRGRCSCTEGVTGEKCDVCPNGPIGPNGCPQRRQSREDSGSLSLPCFCYGHSSRCSAQPGYSVHNITSSFITGKEGWKAATAQGVAPEDAHFRWSPKHQDLEVISKDSLPMYLSAPDPYLGNQLLSYGQNFSFSLRLDRGVRHPSTNDVILEGAGLRVAASLGDLRSIVPCAQKISYSFRLDEQPGSRWRPQLSSFQFQTLLQNLTAIKIRATFGEKGRGYLDNVRLVSARPGGGDPARWVQTCSCPAGHEGQSCERCSAGFRRDAPADGAFSACRACSCRGGGCDPQTGDCFSADEPCSDGFYRDPRQQDRCVRCPCPEGLSCSLPAGSVEPRCDTCPPGTAGPRCDVCQEGFHGDPAGSAGLRRPCEPCRCNGHIDVSVAGSCDRHSGECLKCVNNTAGRSCEGCVRGFYHERLTDACRPCNCNAQSSESEQCDDFGRCRCRPGFEGLRCDRSNCPACFSPIKAKMEDYVAKLKELEARFSDVDSGLKPTDSSAMEAALRAAEELVNDLLDRADELTEMEKGVQDRLSSISRSQLVDGQDIQNISDRADHIRQQQRASETRAKEVQALIEEMRSKLQDANTKLKSADVSPNDVTPGPNDLSELVETAKSLADKHKKKADAVEQTANEALNDSVNSLSLVRTLMNRENKVKELIGDLKVLYDSTSAQVNSLEKQANLLSDDAREESKMADGMLKDIDRIELNIPPSVKEEVDAMVTRLEGLKDTVEEEIFAAEDLQAAAQKDQADAEVLLAKGKAAQQKFDELLDRVNVAKAETERALRRITNNTDDLDDTLASLRGFDQQINSSKALADEAIKRLPGINDIIQQAVKDNTKTESVLEDVSEETNNALETISLLDNLVNDLGNTIDSLPPFASLANETTRLNREVKDLKTDTENTSKEINLALDDARLTKADAEKADSAAADALNNAKKTKEDVGKTLRDINDLLAKMNGTKVDETQLKELEDSVAAQKDAVDNLRPRLQDMEDKEAAQRRQLAQINLDIDGILADIVNLEDILVAVPRGCYNSPPIEEA
ncbi:laminin subunit gamma-2 [Odontesthes bonariensis]|uniref:laminin subunit gamma-2 n=1 Tax=Odontesthes bonariensis TaxID=219752 RepID=UPI003F58AFA4